MIVVVVEIHFHGSIWCFIDSDAAEADSIPSLI